METARFMSRSTDADKGSTDHGAGSGPRPSFVSDLVGVPRAFGVGHLSGLCVPKTLNSGVLVVKSAKAGV